MKDKVQTEEAPRIKINSQTTNDSKNIGQKSCIHILYVDDDLCLLEVSKQMLEMENNFEIDVATSVMKPSTKLKSRLMMR